MYSPVLGGCLLHFSPRCTPLDMQEDDKEPGKQEDPKLRIAWQYRRYIQRQQDRADAPGPPVAPTFRRKGAGDSPSTQPDTTPPSGSAAGTSFPYNLAPFQSHSAALRSGEPYSVLLLLQQDQPATTRHQSPRAAAECAIGAISLI